MIPPKSDPRWQQLIVGKDIPNLSALPTKMLLMRIRLLAKDGTPQKIKEAVDIAYDFFDSNQSVVRNDIKIIFGE